MRMSNNLTRIVSDSKNDASSIARTRVSPSLNPSPFVYDRMGHKVISLPNDSASRKLFGDSQDEKASVFFFLRPLVM